MHTAAYVERIGFHGPLRPTADTLRRLQVAHLLSVPFENLSIHSGEPVLLEDEALFDKIRTTDDDRQETQLSTEADYLDALREHFGIHSVGRANA